MTVEFAQRWPEIEPLLDQLFEVPAADRTAWLREHCADATLRTLVAQALDNVPDVEALERGVTQWLPEIARNPVEATPSVPGYRVRRFVGAGGMASVFEAERELPGGPQSVALKLLRIDVHDPDERRRFLREQRILARLQHPHIAQLLDAGFTPTGTPFLALEFVAGDDIFAHCERSGLGTRERLALFIDVCAAVEYAHRNLIVHRDLKPGNVLVGIGGVKLVDFGIAKLLTGDGERTRTAARRLTRAYAAPEQFDGDAATTAIDVYALGVLLAELIAGFKPRTIDNRSAANSGLFDAAPLRRRLGSDLHAIVREATRPQPMLRYATVAALREDIERHLDGRPLQARADTFGYRMFTFAKRHAFAVAAGAAIVAVLIGAATVSLHESQRARRAALDARTQARVAEGEARRADAVKSFLEGLFDSASPGSATGESAEELLARGRERADRDFAAQPELRVEILALVGDLERRSGHPDHAQPVLEQAAALAAAQFGASDRRTLHVEYLIAKNTDELGRARDAMSRLQKALDAFASGANRGTVEEVQALSWLAGLHERVGESANALDAGEKALALARRVLPSDSDALTEVVTNFGWTLMDAGHADRAEPLLREALARKRERFGARHADVAEAARMLTWALIRLGRYGESEQLMREAIDIDLGAFPRPHPQVSRHLNELANVLKLEGKLGEAGEYYAKAIALDRALAPAAALDEAVSLGNVARIRFRQGAYAEAEAGLRDSIAREQHLLGADYADNGRGHDQLDLAEILIARGRLDEAQGLADDALADARRRHRDAHPDIASAEQVEAELLVARGERAQAVEPAGEAAAIYAALADPRSERAVRGRLLFGEILLDLGRSAEAKPQLQSALAAVKASVPSTAAFVARASADLARAESALGNAASARSLRIEAESALAAIPAEASTDRAAALRRVAALPSLSKL
jgi:serine/threonine-protein kinase